MTGDVIRTVQRFLDERQACEACVRDLVTTGDDLGAIKRIRSRVGEDLASLVLTTARLQSRAIAKLGPPATSPDGRPGVWWVTERSLQQATPWQVARHKSGWLSGDNVADLCCGAGGDAIQFIDHAFVTAIDRDPLIAAMALANLTQVADPSRFRVLCQDVTTFAVSRDTDLHIDPDRRSEGRRTSAPEWYEPNWRDVMQLVRESPAVIKLAPMAAFDDEALPARYHRCWISLQRSVREQSLLSEAIVERHRMAVNGRSAVAIAADGSARAFAPDNSSEDKIKHPNKSAFKSVDQPDAFLIDPDPAIRAAELTEGFAEQFNLRMLGAASGFLTSTNSADVDPTAAALSIVAPVVWWGACDLKRIRRELRSRDARATTVKVRGTDHDPAKILKPLKTTGEQPLTLWIGRSNQGVYAALTDPV